MIAKTSSGRERAGQLLRGAYVLRERAMVALLVSSCAARSSSWGMLVVKGPPSSARGVGSQKNENSSSQRQSRSSRVSFLSTSAASATDCWKHEGEGSSVLAARTAYAGLSILGKL